jgi:hypothetical protein
MKLDASAHADAGIQMLACVDLASGVVLDSSTRGGEASDALDFAAEAVCQLSTSPRVDVGSAPPDAREAFIVSDRAIHALARSERNPDRVIVAVAPSGANVALVMATIRSLADALSA